MTADSELFPHLLLQSLIPPRSTTSDVSAARLDVAVKQLLPLEGSIGANLPPSSAGAKLPPLSQPPPSAISLPSTPELPEELPTEHQLRQQLEAYSNDSGLHCPDKQESFLTLDDEDLQVVCAPLAPASGSDPARLSGRCNGGLPLCSGTCLEGRELSHPSSDPFPEASCEGLPYPWETSTASSNQPGHLSRCRLMTDHEVNTIISAAESAWEGKGTPPGGSFGIVRPAACKHLFGGKTVAVKTPKDEFMSEQFKVPEQEFFEHIKNMNRMWGHPRISKLLGAHLGSQVTVWEFHGGCTLQDRIERGDMSASEIAQFALNWLRFMQSLPTCIPQLAHEEKYKMLPVFVHNDLKVRCVKTILFGDAGKFSG